MLQALYQLVLLDLRYNKLYIDCIVCEYVHILYRFYYCFSTPHTINVQIKAGMFISFKMARNYYVASTTAINNAAASHKINYALNKKQLATGL